MARLIGHGSANWSGWLSVAGLGWLGLLYRLTCWRGYWLRGFMPLCVNLGLMADLCGAALLIPLFGGWCGLKGLISPFGDIAV